MSEESAEVLGGVFGGPGEVIKVPDQPSPTELRVVVQQGRTEAVVVFERQPDPPTKSGSGSGAVIQEADSTNPTEPEVRAGTDGTGVIEVLETTRTRIQLVTVQHRADILFDRLAHLTGLSELIEFLRAEIRVLREELALAKQAGKTHQASFYKTLIRTLESWVAQPERLVGSQEAADDVDAVVTEGRTILTIGEVFSFLGFDLPARLSSGDYLKFQARLLKQLARVRHPGKRALLQRALAWLRQRRPEIGSDGLVGKGPEPSPAV